MPRRGPRSRRWCVPPTILHGPDETLEGAAILVEIPGDLGVLLWRAARDVRLWGEAPPDARENLFADGSGDARLAGLIATDLPAKISAPVDTIHGMLTLGARADASILCICCLEVAAWAHGGGKKEAAVAFAQAGASAEPDFAEAALHTGIYARSAGQDVRAEGWLRRAAGLSRRELNGPAYSAALVELGALYEGRGIAEGAEWFFWIGYRVARRYASPRTRMRAAHGLFRLAQASAMADLRPRDAAARKVERAS
jgi:hypothetical protein